MFFSSLRRLWPMAIGLSVWAGGTMAWPGEAARTAQLVVGRFSEADPSRKIPDKWEPFTFEKIERHTDYRLVHENGVTAVKAFSDNAASGLIRRVRIDPHQYPVIRWRWKISQVYEKGDATRKSGDDYPARIYVAFEYDPEKVGFFEKAKWEAVKLIYGEYPPLAAINYIWANRTPVGTTIPNPFTDRTRMIAVESGNAKAGTWVEETRNIHADYVEAFGKAPPRISGIAIMTDSDNTGEAAVAWYGDIVLLPSR